MKKESHEVQRNDNRTESAAAACGRESGVAVESGVRLAIRSEVENSTILKEEADAVVLKTGEVVDVHDVSDAGEIPGAGAPQQDRPDPDPDPYCDHCDRQPDSDSYGHPDHPPEDAEPVPPGVDADPR